MMEQEQLTENDLTLWEKLYQAEMDFHTARWEFLKKCNDRELVMRKALKSPSDRDTALDLLLYLDVEKRLPFFNDLVDLASVDHASVDRVWQVILSLPKDFLLANIEKSVEPVLNNAVQDAYVEYRCLLQLYSQIDSDLTYRLAQRALQHEDADVIEAGEDYMEWLEKNKQ
ncbi:MAG TPA: hypothetical protein VK203_30340 [Nostocaceae cyanobacterium]|nr:hypothetical protein [Nostocaceae cyanobacterium]